MRLGMLTSARSLLRLVNDQCWKFDVPHRTMTLPVEDVVKRTLLVRHLPTHLSADEQTEMLQHFGATNVRCMGTRGTLKDAAFATFPDRGSAETALGRLHQLDVLGTTLVVEFSRASFRGHHPSLLSDRSTPPDSHREENEKPKTKKVDETDMKDITANIDSLNAKLDFTYPMNTSLMYAYPEPSVSILANISNALGSVPRFYVQVLHLMNRMHLPSPFGIVTPTPALPLGMAPMQTSEPAILEEEDMDVSSTDESEMESSGGEQKDDAAAEEPRQLDVKKTKRRRHKLQKVALGARITTQQQPLVDVFEAVSTAPAHPKTIQLNIQTTTNLIDTPINQPDNIPFTEVAADEVGVADTGNGDDSTTTDGFGKLQPIAKPRDSESDDDDDSDDGHEWGDSGFISSRQLRRGQLSESHRSRLNIFRNYNSGEPTSRLYIKNLAKQVEQKDLHYIFGRYVVWADENEKQMFDIRLMQEGRMKGQAFVTLPSSAQAAKALRDTNAYLLHEKPMVVQFARSAKPKDTDSKQATHRNKKT